MRYNFAVTWYDPDGTSYDITSKVTKIGAINRGVSAADELMAFTAGDCAIEANNWDGFFTTRLDPNATGSTFKKITDLIRVKLVRDSIEIFHGYVIPQTIEVERRTRVARFNVLGPMCLCDNAYAGNIRRFFPENLAVVDDGKSSRPGVYPKGSTEIPVSTASLIIFPGDLILFGTEESGGEEHIVAGYIMNDQTPALPMIVLADPTESDISAGTPVVIMTPYKRNQFLGEEDDEGLVHWLFHEAGVMTVDCRWTGMLSQSSFAIPFGINGIEGHGKPRGLAQYWNPAADLYAMTIGMQYGDDGTGAYGIQNVTGLNGTASGFDDYSVRTDDFGLPCGYYEPSEPGEIQTYSGLDFPCWTPTRKIQTRMDTHRVDSRDFLTHNVTISRTACIRVGSTSYMYRLVFYAPNCKDEGYFDSANGKSLNRVDMVKGGSALWTIRLYRYTTASSGATYQADLTWPTSTIETVARTSNVATIRTTGPHGLVVGESITVSGLFAPYNTFNASAVVTATTDYTFTYANTGTNQTTAYPSGGTVVKAGFTASDHFFQIATGSAVNNQPGIDYEWSLSVVHNTAGVGFDTIVYASMIKQNGNASDRTVERLGINGNSVVELSSMPEIDLIGGGSKALHLDTSHFGARANIYAVQVDEHSGGDTRLIHFVDNGSYVTRLGHVAIGPYWPIMRTLKWNQANGADSRIGFIWSSPFAGTGYCIMKPGDPSLASPANGYEVESRGVLDPTFVMQNDLSAQQTTIDLKTESYCKVYGTERNDICVFAPWYVQSWADPSTRIRCWVGYAANRWFVVTNQHTGFISYANFDGMSVAEALTELAFIVNASWNVEFQTNGQPIGKFVGRDLPYYLDVSGNQTEPKVLQSRDGSLINGQSGQPVLLDATDARAWQHNYPQVTVTGAGENDIGEAGSLAYQQGGLEIADRFIETRSFAQAMAESLYEYYGPGMVELPAPAITIAGDVGNSRHGYKYAAYSTTGVLGVSKEAFASGVYDGTPNGSNYCLVQWTAVPGATAYRVWRSTCSRPGGGTGSIGATSAITLEISDTSDPPNFSIPTPVALRSPRRAAQITVLDDGTDYRPRDQVRLASPYGDADPSDSTAAPVWWIENVDMEPSDPTIRLSVVERDA